MTLQISGVTVTFGDGPDGSTRALDDLSLSLDDGEVVALVGPSGCGKSTLLRVIAGLQPMSAGTLRFDGTDIGDQPPHARDVGLMFQDGALFTHRSVRDNVAFGLRMRSWSKADQRSRVDELLELVGLPDFGERDVNRLSGGEAQRVALARALAPSPRLLLLDEPLGALDRALREELTGELHTMLRELGQTTLHVTHDQDEAFAIADRVAVMHQGRLLRLGTPREVWADPRSEFVARFVGHAVATIDGKRVAIRSDATSIVQHDGDDPDRTGEQATVIGARFRGDRSEVTCATEHGERIVLTPDPPPVGTIVTLRIDPARLAPLTSQDAD